MIDTDKEKKKQKQNDAKKAKEAEKNPHAYEKKSAWTFSKKEEILAYAQDYMAFLSQAKTEREAVSWMVEKAAGAGFKPFKEGELLAGDKFYMVNRKKGLLMGVMGQAPLREGVRLVGAHVDAPRLDLKAQPLYEEESMAFLKTHYYGGIKKYQWLSIPLAIHGVVFLADGSQLDLVWGEADDDPVFTIPDLLPHLAKEQMKKPMSQAVEGEGLNLIFGGMPVEDKEAGGVKARILDLLYEKTGMEEKDFISAELEVVPAGRARHVGLDSAYVGGYGQDDRVCAYAGFRAIEKLEKPQHTALLLLTDKEEIGSTGATGAQSRFLEDALARLAQAQGLSGLAVMADILQASQAISADVSAGVDPNYKNLFDAYNAPQMGKGVVVSKYTGSGGKYSANDADAETMSRVRTLYDQAKLGWQTGELGKIDAGGGGTIAMFLSQLGMATVDSGPALLGMHSPFELADKADIYQTYRAYQAFLERS